MAEAIVSAVANRLVSITEEQIRSQVNLVRGVDEDVRNLSRELNNIRNVLDDAEGKMFKDKTIKNWLKRLEDASYSMDDVLDEWEYAMRKLQIVASKPKVCSCIPTSCLCIKKVGIRQDIAIKIKDLKSQLDRILEEKNRYDFVTSPSTYSSSESWRVQSTSLINIAEVHGRDIDRDILVSKLIMPKGGSTQEESGLHILSVVGVGGVGKTTLAQLVYNDTRVKEYFEIRIWICVSDPFDEARIAKEIIESVGEKNCPTNNQLNKILQCLGESISGKKLFLVLDDVWTENFAKWEPLKNSLRSCGGTGSKILVTTRNERVAKTMGTVGNEIHNLGQLSDDDCWLLLRRVAFFGRDEGECEKFQRISKDIANKCKGLPLAARALGSLLQFKKTMEEWENVLHSEIWELENDIDLFPHLLLSYNELSPVLKHCFSYCAAFPKDSRIHVESLIEKWIALGFLDPVRNVGNLKLKGREYFENLAMRSLFQDFESDEEGSIKSFKMHDIIHDFTQYLRTNGRENVGLKKASCKVCNPLLVSRIKEYRSLFWAEETSPCICDCLRSLKVLDLRGSGLQSVLDKIRKLIHLRWLDLSHNELSMEDLKTICKLYNLQFLWLQACGIMELPREIGNLIRLTLLDLSYNKSLTKLPESICNLHELECLIVDDTNRLIEFPQGIAELTRLRTLSQFVRSSCISQLAWLKNLDKLAGSLRLTISLHSDLGDLVQDARKAELSKKLRIQKLRIEFSGDMDKEKDSMAIDLIMDALEPHRNLQSLRIECFTGSKLPDWMASPLNLLRSIEFLEFSHLPLLPPLGTLPCLEELVIFNMHELQFVGRGFLFGKTETTATTCIIVFPKLKILKFGHCPKWKEWEDITAEEEDYVAVFIMPCLMELSITECQAIRPRWCFENLTDYFVLYAMD